VRQRRALHERETALGGGPSEAEAFAGGDLLRLCKNLAGEACFGWLNFLADFLERTFLTRLRTADFPLF